MSNVTSSIESIPLPPAASQIRRPVKEAKGSRPPVQETTTVTRQVPRNLVVLPAVAPPAFQSVSDFVEAYTRTDETIAGLTAEFVLKAGEAKQKQDDILPHLAFMQSLLSKKGAYHHLVITARKQGHKILWWTDFYATYKDKLWESLRTMERRIAAYRKDPTAPKRKTDSDCVPPLSTADRRALIEGNHKAVEIVSAVEAGRDAKKEIADFKSLMNAKRLDDILQAHEQEPDYKGILQGILRLVEENKESLPTDFVKAVEELTKGGDHALAIDRNWFCSICDYSIKSSEHQLIEAHVLSHYSDETSSEAPVGA